MYKSSVVPSPLFVLQTNNAEMQDTLSDESVELEATGRSTVYTRTDGRQFQLVEVLSISGWDSHTTQWISMDPTLYGFQSFGGDGLLEVIALCDEK